MSIEPTRSRAAKQSTARSKAYTLCPPPAIAPLRLSANDHEQTAPPNQAELFYLQKQIQAQTPMVVVLEDSEKIEGCIEWYDRNALKLRGRQKTLVYKSAIKYMYKVGDAGSRE
jgi:sRNA-binding regulator protein Hfq